MKVKIHAGGEFDTATPDEVRGILSADRVNWLGEIARGDRFRRFSAWAAVATNTVTIGERDAIGPDAGFVWVVRRLALNVTPAVADNLKLYVGSPNDSALIRTDITDYLQFQQGELVLYPGETLYLTGTYTAADGTQVWMTGQAREFPVSLAWRI